MIGQVASYVLLALGFALYLQYSHEFNAITYALASIAVGLAIVSGFGRSYLRYRHAAAKAAEDDTHQCVDVSPRSRLVYDLVAWAAVAAILRVPVFLPHRLNSKDIVQATIALVAFNIARHLTIR